MFFTPLITIPPQIQSITSVETNSQAHNTREDLSEPNNFSVLEFNPQGIGTNNPQMDSDELIEISLRTSHFPNATDVPTVELRLIAVELGNRYTLHITKAWTVINDDSPPICNGYADVIDTGEQDLPIAFYPIMLPIPGIDRCDLFENKTATVVIYEYDLNTENYLIQGVSIF
jgi:hypothetical protein